jgi:hypothetical protein
MIVDFTLQGNNYDAGLFDYGFPSLISYLHDLFTLASLLRYFGSCGVR